MSLYTENYKLINSGMIQGYYIFWIKTKYQKSFNKKSLFYVWIYNVKILASDAHKKIIVQLR